MIETLKWYKEKAESISRFLLAKKTDAVIAIVVELSLDAGTRANRCIESHDALYDACEAAYEKLTDIERYGEHLDNPLPTMLRDAMNKYRETCQRLVR